jgi:hypothetical protein
MLQIVGIPTPFDLCKHSTGKLGNPRVQGAGEQLVALDWAHPQFGNLLAVGTSHGRVLLVTNRPIIASDLSVQQPRWHLCCVLLGIDKMHTKCRVTCVHIRVLHVHVVLNATIGQHSIDDCSCRALAFAPCDAGLMMVVAHEDGKVRIASCSEPHLGHEATSWPYLYLLTTSKAARHPSDQAGKRCTGVSWQPRPHAQQPFLAVATSAAISVWCFDQCVFHTL